MTNTSTTVLNTVIAKNATRTLNAVKTILKSYGKANIYMNVLSETSVEIVADFQHIVSPGGIQNVYIDMKYAINSADKEGYISSIEIGEVSVGENFVEAILSGLRPGMPVVAEAFFPTISYEVKWKNIMKRK